MIGDPAARYREDPVRILRVVRFVAKLGFTVHPATQAPIRELSGLLANVPASRLFDEMVKLLQTGHALKSLDALRAHGLLRGVFPVLEAALDPATGEPGRFVQLALADTDRRVADGLAVVPSFLLSCLMWHEVQARWSALRTAGEPVVPALQQAIDAVFDARIGDVSGRGRLAADMREIWLMQPRFERRSGNGPRALIEQPRFRAGYDFLRLRADAGELDAELAEWWEDFALGSEEDRVALLQAVRPAPQARRKPAAAPVTAPDRGRAAAVVGAEAAAATPAADDEDGAAAPAARKRRRRRRRGGSGGEGGGASGGGVGDAGAEGGDRDGGGEGGRGGADGGERPAAGPGAPGPGAAAA
jgi:poly(A) polymerase